MIKLFYDTDILIVGGGSAGVAAAVAAAKEGLQVSLIETNAFLGGKGTAAEVGTICGLYHFSSDPEAKYIVRGFAREFANKLKHSSQTEPLHNKQGLHYLPYDVEGFKNICNELIKAFNVKVFLNASVCDVVMVDNLIKGVSIKSENKILNFSVKCIVDCSGESIISRLANLPFLESITYQAAAQVFSLKDVDEDHEGRLGMILMKALGSAVNNKSVPPYFDRVYIVPGSLKQHCVTLKLGLPVIVTYLPGNSEEIKRCAIEFVDQLTAFLVANLTAFRNASIQHIAPEPGLRTGIRTLGHYVLTETDVLTAKKYDDAVANGSWPIEIWGQDKKVKMEYFEKEDFYQVPSRCLQSKSISNLFMGGSNISATTEAIASARVIGTCLQTGYAAGIMAAGKVFNHPMDNTIKRIQNQQL